MSKPSIAFRHLARIISALVISSLLMAASASAAPTPASPATKKLVPAKAPVKAPAKATTGKATAGKAASAKPNVALQKPAANGAAPKGARPAALAPTTALGTTFLVSDLRRIIVGNQAGVLKVVSRESNQVAFIKDAPGTEMKGIDGVQWAPLEDRHRQAILAALAIQDNELDALADRCVASFEGLPALQTMALLGVLASHGEGRITPATREKIHHFLVGILDKKDVVQRRHAVLALALSSTADEATVTRVLDFMSTSRNSWETFSVQQFFNYHRNAIKQMPGIETIRQRIQASGNPYTPAILQMLQ